MTGLQARASGCISMARVCCWRRSEAFIRQLDAKGRIKAIRITPGTNISRVPVSGMDTARLRGTLASRGIEIEAPAAGALTMNLTLNESWARRPAAELAAKFLRASGRV